MGHATSYRYALDFATLLNDAGPRTFVKLPRGDLRGVAIAWMLWRRTSIPQLWIGKRLALRSAANVSQRIRLFDRTIDKGPANDFTAWKNRQVEF